MPRQIRKFLQPLLSQDRALTNAREAATVLARHRVERDEVRLFLEELEERGQEAHSA